LDAIIERAEAKDGDYCCLVRINGQHALLFLELCDLSIAKQTGLLEKAKDNFAFTWVVDFPLFEYDEDSKRYVAMHHPFTSPKFEDMEFIDENPGKVRARAYDIVVNGAEVGGGSIRIHDTAIQQKNVQVTWTFTGRSKLKIRLFA